MSDYLDDTPRLSPRATHLVTRSPNSILEQTKKPLAFFNDWVRCTWYVVHCPTLWPLIPAGAAPGKGLHLCGYLRKDKGTPRPTKIQRTLYIHIVRPYAHTPLPFILTPFFRPFILLPLVENVENVQTPLHLPVPTPPGGLGARLA
ncbi:hypothetical protein ACRALDRAFT_2058052 [Sodiomyces alcalophilus JCM 7366]|uniref:uncharacterized protein n=1 Tax=Sodiomyces alcalophilus JCM 7366 TaxID=591952 RepID=UPI0039B5F8EF